MKYFSKNKKWMAYLILLTFVFTSIVPAGPVLATTPEGEDSSAVLWEGDTLYLNNATLNETVKAAKIVVSGDCTINAGEANGIESEGAVNIEGNGSLTITGANGIMASSVTINGIDVDFTGTSCGVQVYNEKGDATVTLTNVNGSITGGYAGIYVNGECANSEASVTMKGCDLDVVSTATSYNGRARKSGISVYVSEAEKVESSINVLDSKVDATGADAGLSINNYLGDADATNNASSRINITNSTVTANGTNGTWAGIFASVLGQHEDADSIITITNSSVYATSPNTGILTSSQKGESKIILDNSVLGASGKTALSMIEETSQAQTAELKNGSTYIQMTPAAIMKGEIVNDDKGKTIIATAGEGITYDATNHYYVIPKGSEVTENFTDGTVKTYTFNNQAGGVGGNGYANDVVWGYDVAQEIIITTPEELVEFATRTQAGGDLSNCEGWTVKLGNDIDMTGYDWYYRNAEGTIVTDHRIPDFIGTFDGQGYSIKNMSYRDEYAAATDMNKLAFILQGKSYLKNLTLDGISVNTVAPAYFAGLVKDYAWSGSSEAIVENCCVKNVAVNAADDLTFGGMFYRLVGGKAVNNSHVENMTINVKGALVGDNNGRNGGFVATGGEPMTFTKCSVKNLTVNAESTGKYLGGFIGGASLSGNYNGCSVNGFELNAKDKFSAVGGFVAYTSGSAWGPGSTYKNCVVSDLDIETTNVISVGAGGFIGNFNGQGNHEFIDCTTQGTISGDAYAGGFAGWLYGRDTCSAAFTNCSAAVNILNNDYYGAGFVGNYEPSGTNVCNTTYDNCTASGDVFATEPIGSFLNTDNTAAGGIVGGTYNYDPENVDSSSGETNNVASGYRALDNGDGTWTVFPDHGKEVVKVAFHRWNDEQNGYENWRTVEVFKDVDFSEDDYNNQLNYSHKAYRFEKGIAELDEEADEKTNRPFTFWTDAPDGTAMVLDNEIEVLADMNVYAAYGTVCRIVETGVEYYKLSDAVAEANKLEGANTIEMLASIDFDSDKALSVKGDLTIVGKYTVSRGDYTGTLFTVPKGSSLTLDGGLTIDGNNNWAMDMDLYNEHLETMAQQGISIYTTGMDRKTEIDPYNTEKASQYFNPEAGAPIATDYMIKVTGAGTVNLNDVTIQNNYTPKSGLVNTSVGTVVNLDGAKILHCASVEGSGTVVNASGKITINIEEGTLIDGNHVGGNHGLFRVYSGAVVNMSGGAISNTTGWNSNGVVIGLYGAGSTFNMSGGLITGNSSVFGADNGRNAAVYLHANSTMNMTGGTISFNNGRSRGGIDTYKETSTLNINRADQYFVDGVYLNENSKDAYKSSNHPMIVDNLSRANNSNHDVGTSNGNYLHWWVTGGIYTQDVDEYCAKGYVCIPYEDSERTDDYIVVPGYRVNYYTVEKELVVNEETGEATTEYETTLEMKLFHLLPRDKFWYEMDERADYYELHNDAGGTISTWYTEKELTNIYDFNTPLEKDINLYGEWDIKEIVDSKGFSVTKTVTGDKAPAADNAYEFQLKIDARVEKWTAVLATKKWELERAIEKAKADLAKVEEAVSESEKAFEDNSVAFTTGSAYKFVMADEPVTTSGSALEYTYTIVDQSGNTSTTTSSAILWDGLTTDKDETVIDAVIDTIKTIAKGFANLFQNGWKVDFLNALNETESSTPSALGFYTEDVEALLKAENDKLAAEENVKATETALADFMKNEATTPTAIKVTFTPQEGSESRLESKVFELAPDTNGHVIGFNLFGNTGYDVDIEATTGAMITYRVSEVGGFETEDYLGTVVNVGDSRVSSEELVRNTGELTLAGNVIEFINHYLDGSNNNTNNNNDNNNDDNNNTTTKPEETIDNTKVPLGDVETPDETIDDNEVPLGDVEVPDDSAIPDEELDASEIPLGDAPATGDAANAAPFMALLLAAIAGLAITRRKFN